MNFTPGGLLGYCSSKCMTSRKVPSSNGVSAGPIMTAFLRNTSAGAQPKSSYIEGIPGHNIVCHRRRGDAGRRIRLHALRSGRSAHRVISIAVGRQRKRAGFLRRNQQMKKAIPLLQPCLAGTYLEVAHETATGRCRHRGGVWSSLAGVEEDREDKRTEKQDSRPTQRDDGGPWRNRRAGSE